MSSNLNGNGNIYYIIISYSLLIPILTFPIYKERFNLKNRNQTVLKEDSRHGSYFARVGSILFGVIGLIYFLSHFSEVCNSNESPVLCFPIYVFFYTLLSACAGFVFGALVGIVVDLTKK